MPDTSLEVWTAPRSELSQIEFRTHVVPSADGLDEIAETWLAGDSVAVERLRTRATHVGSSGAAVIVIHGDAGVGKLRVAQWIHRCSSRSSNPLLVLDSDDPTLNGQLDRVIQAIVERSRGLARGLAGGQVRTPGTLVLRNWERAEQGALTRLFEILGCQGVELVCALVLISKRNPEQLRELSALHTQLLARASNSLVSVPALRHRGGDIQALARHFANEAAHRYDKSIRGISAQALSLLEAHDFPGNVRELQVMVEQAILRSSGDWVTDECFWGLGEEAPLPASEASELVIRLPGSSLREIEIQALRLALELSGGRVVRASEMLGITRHALRRKLEKFGLNELRSTPPTSTRVSA